MARILSHVVHPDYGDFSLEVDENGDVALYQTLDPQHPEKKTRMDMPVAVQFALTRGIVAHFDIHTVEEAHRFDRSLRLPANVTVIPIRRGAPVVAVPITGSAS